MRVSTAALPELSCRSKSHTGSGLLPKNFSRTPSGAWVSRAWASSTVPIQGFVMALIGPNNAPQVWGPRFSLDPAFSDKEPLLLGRADFFRVFTVTFQEHAQTPVFHLDYA